VFPQDQRMEFLLTELKGKRPLLPPCMETSPDVQEVIATFRYVFTCCVCVQVCLHVYA
jgi:phosphoenolpyruvate carboxylase